MLTVHIVTPETVALHGALQKSILKSTSVIVDDSKSRSEARVLAREAATLGRHKDVVAVVPCSSSSTRHAQVRDWEDNADEMFEVSAKEKTLIKSRWI